MKKTIRTVLALCAALPLFFGCANGTGSEENGGSNGSGSGNSSSEGSQTDSSFYVGRIYTMTQRTLTIDGEDKSFKYESEKDMLKYFHLWIFSESEALEFAYGWSVNNDGKIYDVKPNIEKLPYDLSTFGTEQAFENEYVKGTSKTSVSSDGLTLTSTSTYTMDGKTYVNSVTYKYDANPQFYGAKTAWTGPVDYGYDPHGEWPYVYGTGFKEGDLILTSVGKTDGTYKGDWFFITDRNWGEPKLRYGEWGGAHDIWEAGDGCGDLITPNGTIAYRMTAADAAKINSAGGFVICCGEIKVNSVQVVSGATIKQRVSIGNGNNDFNGYSSYSEKNEYEMFMSFRTLNNNPSLHIEVVKNGWEGAGTVDYLTNYENHKEWEGNYTKDENTITIENFYIEKRTLGSKTDYDEIWGESGSDDTYYIKVELIDIGKLIATYSEDDNTLTFTQLPDNSEFLKFVELNKAY